MDGRHQVFLTSTTNSFWNKSNASKNEAYPIPHLKAIDDLVTAVPLTIRQQLEKTVIVACQHNLETTLSIYKAMKTLGVQRIYSIGKCYSDSEIIKEAMVREGIILFQSNKPKKAGQYIKTCRKDIQLMWQRCLLDLQDLKNIDTIIVLDDGARCLEEIPSILCYQYKIAGIEQTRGGLYSHALKYFLFPLIEIASSAIKRQVEPLFIAKSVIAKLEKLLPKLNLKKDIIYGVMGYGAIGAAIADYLLKQGHYVVVYDDDESVFQPIPTLKKLFRMSSIESVLAQAQCIFSCVGKDITQGIPVLDIVKDNTVLISCSSEDKEFNSLLQSISDNTTVIFDTLSDIICEKKGKPRMMIARGGFPINFDGEPWNVPANEIEPTQGALLGAVVQAVLCAEKPVGDGMAINRPMRLALDPNIQRFIIRSWRKTDAASQHSPVPLDCFDDMEWIIKNSGGKHQKSELLASIFMEKSVQSSVPSLRSRL